MVPVLSTRALTCATLARQLLVERADDAALDAIEHLVGLQAQAPLAPYVGLWTRLAGFATDDLATLLAGRRVVRMGLMRATIHLVSATDALELWPLLQPVSERGFRSGSPFGRRLADPDGTLDLTAVLAVASDLVETEPRSRAAIGEELARRWPDLDRTALSHAATILLPLVQVPPRGLWGHGGGPVLTTVEHWLGRRQHARPSLRRLVLRYLGAFGPAGVADVQAWCGLTRLREVVDDLNTPGRRRVREFVGPAGSPLFDRPDSPRPDADLPLPVRFLPEYDNLLLGHADRSRFLDAGRLPPLFPGNGASRGTVLVDGRYRADWASEPAALRVVPFGRLSTVERQAVDEEGRRLQEFLHPDGAADVRFG